MEQTKDLHLLGVSFRTAPAAVREALSFNRDEAAALLRQAAAETPGLEAAILATCNRSEFYLATPPGSDAVGGWLQSLRRLRPNAPVLRSDCLRYQAGDAEVVRHLARVACGLNSSILGDVQILGQVKETMAVSAECGTLGNFLSRAFGQALHAGRRARAATMIGHGAAGIGSALVGMIASHPLAVQPDRIPFILVVGAGHVARDFGRHAAKRRLARILFANRTDEKARELAGFCGGEAIPWMGLRAALVKADIVVTAMASPQPILTRDLMDQLADRREGRPLLVIDAGLPRNVEPGSRFEVIDIDTIRERQEDVLGHRRAAIPAVENIVEEEVFSWEQWRSALPVEGLIKLLYEDAAVSSHEAASNLSARGPLTDSQMEQILSRSMKKLLHHHVRRLRTLHSAQGVAC